MSIATTRAAIVQRLRAAIPVSAVTEVLPLGGRYNLAELRRQSATLPSIHVAMLGLGRIEHIGGVRKAHVRWGAFVACQDATGPAALKRDARVLVLAEEVLDKITAAEWPVKSFDVEGAPVYSTELDQQGVALFEVEWTELVTIRPVNAAELDELQTLHAEWSLDANEEHIVATDDIVLRAEEEEEP